MKIERLFVFYNQPPIFYNREFNTDDGYTIDHIGHIFVIKNKQRVIEISDSLPHIVESSKE